MNEFLASLMELFPPPKTKSFPVRPDDFSRYRLLHPPPVGLTEMLEVYGSGIFQCSEGDPIELLLPTDENVAFCQQCCRDFAELVQQPDLTEDLYTADGLWTGVAQSTGFHDVILWAQSSNGVLLFYVWLSPEVGWAALIVESSLTDTFCVFRSPSIIIAQAFTGRTPLDSVFPKAVEPFFFEAR